MNQLLGLGEVPEDGSDLPRGCAPYLPSSVEVLLRTVERANISARDVFVDVGSGLGRATTLVHLLTGAASVGLEIQAGLVEESRRLAGRLQLERVSTLHGDASKLIGRMTLASVFFFYCPFGGQRLAQAMQAIEPLAHARPLRLCFIDMPAPKLPWLSEDVRSRDDIANVSICRSTLHSELAARAALVNSRTLSAL
ncbi:MAG: hypothetical protein QM756_00505 [Polyangiaceae bacterium]